MLNSLHACFACFCRLLTFFKINFFKTFFQEHYQSVKGLLCRSWSWSKRMVHCIYRGVTSFSEDCVVQTLMKCCLMHHFIRVFTACQSTRLGVFSIQRAKTLCMLGKFAYFLSSVDFFKAFRNTNSVKHFGSKSVCLPWSESKLLVDQQQC